MLMELQNKTNNVSNEKYTPSWFGSTASQLDEKRDDNFMTFQSKEPIISIQMDEKTGKEKRSSGAHGHGHGITVEHPTSYPETLMHLLKGNIGSGLFAMGDAIRNAGIALGPGVVILLGVICVHCMHMLLTASRKMLLAKNMTEAPDFAETVELCFATGPKSMQRLAPTMKKLVNIFLCITQLGFCCVYFVFISSNVKQVLDYYGYVVDVHLHMAVLLLPILLSCLVRNLKYLAPLSAVANLFMLVGIVITLYYASQDLPPVSERNYVADISRIPLFFGTALFAFEGIGLVLPLQNEMKNKDQFSKPLGVLNVGMGVVICLYLLIGCIGYMKYGENIMGSVTLNLPQDEILGQAVKLIISLGILMTYALQFYIPIDVMWPSINKTLGPFKFPVLAECTFRSSIVLLTFVLAEAIPYLNLFISLVGAVSSTALALMFPPLLEMVTKSNDSKLTAYLVVKNVLILSLGIVGCITGTYESVISIIHAFSKS